MYRSFPGFALLEDRTETGGFLGIDWVADRLNGGVQKRRRTRQAQRERDQAIAELEQIEAERRALALQRPSRPMTPAAPRGQVGAVAAAPSLPQRAIAIVKTRSPLFGLPWGGVGVLAGVGLAIVSTR